MGVSAVYLARILKNHCVGIVFKRVKIYQHRAENKIIQV